ncbi:MAG: GTP cyclohydrolase II [Anaerolineales bacterium]|jgi:GTP cyclohydrolase II
MNNIKVRRLSCARIPTQYGEFQLCLYSNNIDNKEHLALVKGNPEGKSNVLVRVHSECFTGDVLGSKRCDCGEQLDFAMRKISEAEQGVIIYLRQEGRGIGLLDKLRAYNLQDEGYDTVDANLLLGHTPDEREYSMAAAILEELDIHSIRLLTNNPHKIEDLETKGIEVNDRIPVQVAANQENALYLETKRQRMNHKLGRQSASEPDEVETFLENHE